MIITHPLRLFITIILIVAILAAIPFWIGNPVQEQATIDNSWPPNTSRWFSTAFVDSVTDDGLAIIHTPWGSYQVYADGVTEGQSIYYYVDNGEILGMSLSNEELHQMVDAMLGYTP